MVSGGWCPGWSNLLIDQGPAGLKTASKTLISLETGERKAEKAPAEAALRLQLSAMAGVAASAGRSGDDERSGHEAEPANRFQNQER